MKRSIKSISLKPGQMRKKEDTISNIRNERKGNSLVVQWLGFWASTAGSLGSIPGRGSKILQDVWCSKIKLNYKNKKGEMKEGILLQIQWILNG